MQNENVMAKSKFFMISVETINCSPWQQNFMSLHSMHPVQNEQVHSKNKSSHVTALEKECKMKEEFHLTPSCTYGALQYIDFSNTVLIYTTQAPQT